MHVYLARHGEADASGSDDRRKLTERGRRSVESIASRIRDRGATAGVARHSGKKRAAETAAILAPAFGARVDEAPLLELIPEADPFVTASWIESRTEPVLLVSHLPLLERLASALELGSLEPTAHRFTPGTVMDLEKVDGAWRVAWILTPGG